jgi:hypothetical protein
VEESPKTPVEGDAAKVSRYGGGRAEFERLQQILRNSPEGRNLAPKGVYRFKSHEEADEWMTRMLNRPDRWGPPGGKPSGPAET